MTAKKRKMRMQQSSALVWKKCMAFIICSLMAFCMLPPLRAEASNQYTINGVTVSIDGGFPITITEKSGVSISQTLFPIPPICFAISAIRN